MRIDETLKRGIKLVINHLGKFGYFTCLDKINGIGTKTTLITSLKEYYKKSNEARKNNNFMISCYSKLH